MLSYEVEKQNNQTTNYCLIVYISVKICLGGNWYNVLYPPTINNSSKLTKSDKNE